MTDNSIYRVFTILKEEVDSLKVWGQKKRNISSPSQCYYLFSYSEHIPDKLRSNYKAIC